jgi:hypothetical protein
LLILTVESKNLAELFGARIYGRVL